MFRHSHVLSDTCNAPSISAPKSQSGPHRPVSQRSCTTTRHMSDRRPNLSPTPDCITRVMGHDPYLVSTHDRWMPHQARSGQGRCPFHGLKLLSELVPVKRRVQESHFVLLARVGHMRPVQTVACLTGPNVSSYPRAWRSPVTGRSHLHFERQTMPG